MRPDTADLQRVARQLECACRQLLQSLDLAERAAPDETAEACAAHLAEARRLRPVLTEAASALSKAAGVPGPMRGELEASMRDCARLLRRSAEAYGRLTGRASSELAGLDRELRQTQRGGQVLRTYRHALR